MALLLRFSCSISARQLLDHSVLIQNDLNQLFAAEGVKTVQDPGCTIWALGARIFKSSYMPLAPLINYFRDTDLLGPFCAETEGRTPYSKQVGSW